MFVFVRYQQALLFIRNLLYCGFHFFKDGSASLIDSSGKGDVGAERMENDEERLLKWKGVGAIGQWEYLRRSCQFNDLLASRLIGSFELDG